MSLQWIVEETGNPRFPYRIAIEQDAETLFAVRSQDAWPGPKGHIFCIRDGSAKDERDLFREKERVPIAHLERFGRSIRVVLDRPTKKRCEFLIIEKPYKTKEGTYEQIFFRTQAAINSHKSKSRVSLQPANSIMQIAVDIQERYPWKFPKAEVRKMKLPAGDYALLWQDRIAAVVERKTYENLLTDFGSIVVLHQSLQELCTFPFAAFIIEANYGDFLNPKRLGGRWPPSHGYRVISELQVMHPHLPIVFARTRKEANLWAYGFFRAVIKYLSQKEKEQQIILTSEPLVPYTAVERLDDRVMELLKTAPEGLSLSEISLQCADIGKEIIQRALQRMKAHSIVSRSGRGKKAKWFFVQGQKHLNG